MKKELSITVSLPGIQEATYRFEGPFVRVGRSPECHLSICHEAMPRELCLAWLEEDGSRVRVEERPHLTNPLLMGKSMVTGGVSKESVELSVGPLKLRFAPSTTHFAQPGRHSRKKSKMMAAIATGMVMIMTLAFYYSKNQPTSSLNTSFVIPDSPFCKKDLGLCESPVTCIAEARLLATRSEELLLRPKTDRSDEVRAASLLLRSAKLYAASGSTQAEPIRRKATQMKQSVSTAYKRDVIALRQALSRSAGRAQKEAAKRVLSYLIDCPGPNRLRLENLLAGHREKEE